MADIDLVNQCDIDVGPIYAASKAALNIIVAKFNAEYKKDGVLFLSISPGLVEVGRYANGTYLSIFPALARGRVRTSSGLLTHLSSHAGANEWPNGIRGQARSVCSPLQGPNHPRRIGQGCSVRLGECKH